MCPVNVNWVAKSMEQSPWEADSHSVKKFPTFYGTRRFITVFTTARHWSLPWTRWIQSTTSHPITLRSILILSYNLRLGLPSGLFQIFRPKSCVNLFSLIRAACPAHLILLDSNTIGEACKEMLSTQIILVTKVYKIIMENKIVHNSNT